MISIIDFLDYKKFLLEWARRRQSFERGVRSRLAQAAECQSAFISQVLNGKAHLSLEQGHGVAEFLQLNPVEAKYFLNMISYARAGTPKLRRHFAEELAETRALLLDLKKQSGSQQLDAEAQAVYYSSWIYAAVHVIVTIPRFQDVRSIAEALKLETSDVAAVVGFLTSRGLLSVEQNRLIPGPTQVHLSRTSPFIYQHHTHWRLRAVERLRDGDLHYSTVSSLSHEDVDKLKARLTEVIADYVAQVRPSSEETLYGFNLDFYSLI